MKFRLEITHEPSGQVQAQARSTLGGLLYWTWVQGHGYRLHRTLEAAVVRVRDTLVPETP